MGFVVLLIVCAFVGLFVGVANKHNKREIFGACRAKGQRISN